VRQIFVRLSVDSSTHYVAVVVKGHLLSRDQSAVFSVTTARLTAPGPMDLPCESLLTMIYKVSSKYTTESIASHNRH